MLFFDELRNPKTRLPTGKCLPPLFDFTDHELESPPVMLDKLIPAHVRNKFKDKMGEVDGDVDSKKSKSR